MAGQEHVCQPYPFGSRRQRQYGQLRSRVHAIQNECRDHVGQEEDQLRKELQQALTQESSMYRDRLHQALQHHACRENYADELST